MAEGKMDNLEEMVAELWERWAPVPCPAVPLRLAWFAGEVEGSHLALTPNGGTGLVLLCFGKMIAAHRVTQRVVAVASGILTSPEAEGEGGLFRVMGSRYLLDFEEESLGMTDREAYVHLAFVDDAVVVDIATAFLPVVELVDQESLVAHRCSKGD